MSPKLFLEGESHPRTEAFRSVQVSQAATCKHFQNFSHWGGEGGADPYIGASLNNNVFD